MSEATTVFELVGGEEFFVTLVNDFYDRVENDSLLMAVYPQDLAEPRRTTAGFLAQYWGGPATYSEERGHPRLRMRHAPFRIRQLERDRWLTHMLGATEALVTERELPQEVLALMGQYFDQGSTAMINSHDPVEPWERAGHGL